MLIARIGLWRRWIVRSQYWPTVLGAAIGFLLACAVTVNTLSSPVGPILSTLLIGVGALLGSMRAQSAVDPRDRAVWRKLFPQGGRLPTGDGNINEERAMAQATLKNQKKIIANQRTIVTNQGRILKNQKAIVKNQKKILKNQGRILRK
jgi:hypothetical protein